MHPTVWPMHGTRCNARTFAFPMAETLVPKRLCLTELMDTNRPSHGRAADSGQNDIEPGITGLTLWAVELQFVTQQ